MTMKVKNDRNKKNQHNTSNKLTDQLSLNSQHIFTLIKTKLKIQTVLKFNYEKMTQFKLIKITIQIGLYMLIK